MSEFCQHTDRTGKRCVLGKHSNSNHEMQPASSSSVRTIVRQEELERRLTDSPVEKVVKALDEVTGNAPAPDSSASRTEMWATERRTGVETVDVSASETSTKP